MVPKPATGKSSAQPTRVSSRAKPAPKATPEAETVGKAPAGKRKTDTKAEEGPAKKRKATIPTIAAANSAPTAKPSKAKTSEPASRATATKRKSDDVDDGPVKRRARAAAAVAPKKAAPKAAQPKALPVINTAPSEKLDVWVMGEGESGELGLGTGKGAMGAKRPRIHPVLSSGDVDVVHLALGGMHAAALTRDNQILTWGVNDNFACGRDTSWAGGLKDMDAGSDDESGSDSDDNGLNPREATPTAIEANKFAEGTIFVQLAAGDSCTFALTAEGAVYGWGTFRDNNGVLGFRPDIEHAKEPMLIPELKKITHLACGNNHALALDINGNVFVWGAGEQNQLGRRIVERTRMSCLMPRELGIPKKQAKYISSGGEHSFAILKNEKVYSWGLNNYGQTGIPDNAGMDEAIISKPTVVKQLGDFKLSSIKGGSHHSLAVTDDGTCLVWGRAEGGQVGIDTASLPDEDVIMNHNKVGILKKPTPIPSLKFKYATTASEHSIALTTNGQAYSWGFSLLYQTGLGTDDDVKIATLIENTAVRGRNLNWAGTGGQYSALTSVSASQNKATVNGTSAAAAAPPQPAASTSAQNGVPAPGAHKAAVVNGVAPSKEVVVGLENKSKAGLTNGI